MALKILLADDSMTAQNMGKKILADAGYEVFAVSNGAAAIKKIAADKPDIVILDVYMPGYTGLEVCERVKAANETASIPVLLTVGKMEAFNPEEANKAKADGVMIKPFEATDLIAAVQTIANRVLGVSQAAKPASAPPQRVAPPSSADDTLPITPPEIEEVITASQSKAQDQTVRLSSSELRTLQEATGKRAALEDEAVEYEFTPSLRDRDEEKASEPELVLPDPVRPQVHDPEMPAVGDAPLRDFSRSASAFAGALADKDSLFDAEQAPAAPIDEVPFHPATAAAVYELSHDVQNEPDVTSKPFLLVEQPEAQPAATNPPSVLEPVLPTSDVQVMQQGMEPVAPAFELETSAPVDASFEDYVVPELEVSVMQPVAHAPSESAPGLEINSPISHDSVQDAPDPALVTESEELSTFTTQFGVPSEKAEDVHVGLVTDLPPEQAAAVFAPALSPEEDTVIPSSMYPFVSHDVNSTITPAMPEVPVPDPAVHAAVAKIMPEGPTAKPETMVTNETAEASVQEAAVAPVESTPAVEVPAHDPSLDDTQAIAPYVDAVSAEHRSAFAPSIENEIEAEPVNAFASVLAAAPEAEPTSAISEASSTHAASEIPSDGGLSTMAETAWAAAAGAAASTVSHLVSQPVDSFTPVIAEAAAASTESPAVEESAVPEQSAAAASAIDSAPAALSDQKLTAAVARALEQLKPQLIDAILKELEK